ncbi:MATE family efflux transporter [Fusobacterium sp. PH5-44]|uniref:MATE family efflux transporter n=2 Tax=unclassified Fusobacterium TaxID=2648384 RepID=UPI003D22C59D
MEYQKHQFMGTEKITKLLFKFSLPAIVGMLVNALYNLVDRIYIGNIEVIGKDALAGVGLVFPVTLFVFAFSVLIGLGSANNISILLGKKENSEAEKFLGNALALSIIVSALLVIVVSLNIDNIVSRIGGSVNTSKHAKDYLSILALGFPGALLSYTLNAGIRADGNPKKSMTTLLIGALTNIILDPILIFGFGMGVKGAAVATIISQYVSAIWTLYYFTSGLSGIALLKKNVKISLEKTLKAVSIGAAPFALQIGASAINYMFNTTMGKYGGDTAVSAIAIVQGVIMFISMPVFGINQGLQPILGYNYGAKLYSRVKEALFKGIVIAVLVCTFNFLIIQFLSQYVIHIFNQDPDLIALASKGLRIKTMVLPVAGMQIVSSIYFQAVGKPKLSIVMGLSRQIILLIPSIYILSYKFGVNGVWFATPTADVLSALLTLILLRRELLNLKYLEIEEIEKEKNI